MKGDNGDSLRGRGYMGKVLHVDLGSGLSREEELDPRAARLFLGGKGIATYLLHRETRPGTPALSPDMALIFGTGPLNGTLSPVSGKFVVVSRSPATGAYLDSYCGGPFGNMLKAAGFDFLVIKGAASSPSVLVIDEREVRVEPAGDLWGELTVAAGEKLHERFGPGFEFALIGPAGERLSPISGILSELRIAGRGGIGAVMGSKNLKAVAVRGTSEVRVASPEDFSAASWVAFRTLRLSSPVQRLTKEGSVNILELINSAGGLPTRNFRDGRFEGARELSGEAWRRHSWIADSACQSCPIACTKIGLVRQGPMAGTKVDGPEYETAFSFGSVCGVSDRDAVLAANHLCDLYGVDTISAGVIAGFVMELAERGMVTGEQLGGTLPGFGDAEAMVGLVERICKGDPVGRFLEKGVRRLAEEDFPSASGFAMHVKGLEMPAYLPMAAKGIALGYAISERGACHLHGAPIGELLGSADPLVYEGKARLVRAKQLDAAIIDSSVMCYFADFGITLKEIFPIIRAATGFDYSDLGELEETADRIITLTRLFNLREGFGRKDDALPERCLKEPPASGPAAGQVTDISGLLDEYYRIMGWDGEGRPVETTLARLGLTEPVITGSTGA